MKAALFVFPVILFCSLFTAAQSAPNTQVPSKPSVIKKAPHPMSAEMRSNFLAKTGGLIMSKAEGPAILFLNTQTRVSSATINEPVTQIEKILRLSTVYKDNHTDAPVTAALEALTDKMTAAVVVIGDSKGYPALLVAPESRWALINIAALDGADVSAETLAARTQKEIWRAFGYLMGAANSNFDMCLMKTVFSTDDLDALKSKCLSPEPFNKILAQAQKLGIKSSHMTTYRKAVEEGWAPAPTNEIQQAIWKGLKNKRDSF